MDEKKFKKIFSQELKEQLKGQEENFDNQFKEHKQDIKKQFTDHKQEIKKQFDDHRQEIRKQFDDHKSEVKNQYQEHKEETKRHQKMLLEEFDKRLGIVAEVQTEHSGKFKGIEKKLDAILEMTANNTENIEFIKSMLKRKVDVEEFETLEKRVGLLEKKLRLA